MGDFARLEKVLAKLRQRERAPGEGRRLGGGDGPARLAALVTEIDETILPRRLSFSVHEAGTLHLAVANRRLQALLAPAPKGVPEALVGKKLADANDPEVAELGAALGQILGASETVPIAATRQKTPFPSDVGIPAPQLARVWGAGAGDETAQADPGALLTGFLNAVSGDASAWLRIEGEAVTDQGGEEAAVRELGQLAAVFLDGYFSRFEAAFPHPAFACGTLVSPGGAGRGALMFVEVGNVSAVILAPSDKITGVALQWQRMVAV